MLVHNGSSYSFIITFQCVISRNKWSSEIIPRRMAAILVNGFMMNSSTGYLP